MSHADTTLVTFTESIQAYCHGGIGDEEIYMVNTKAAQRFNKIAAELGTAKVGHDNRGHAAIPRNRLAEVFTEKTLPAVKYAVLDNLQQRILAKSCEKAELETQLDKLMAKLVGNMETAEKLKADLEGYAPPKKPGIARMDNVFTALSAAVDSEDDE